MKNYELISTSSKSKRKVPYCIHGPHLLLEDLNEKISEYKRKYVCSAIRTNDCKPFLNFDLEKFKENHFKKRKNFQNRLIQTLKSTRKERKWCVDCSILLLPDELEHHEDHLVKDNLTLKQLRSPTKLISANVEKKEEAQYFFSVESLKVILRCIVKNKFTHVLCIGCPSVHEQLVIRNKKLNIKSFLLDIDSRYLQFYSSTQFLCFNMANNYLFEKDKYIKNLNSFLAKSNKLLIIVDPPFGIMIPALADTLMKLKKKINYFKKEDSEFKMNMMLFHLYFYEKRIINVFPELKMMDYKISYSNHKKMNETSHSIARLFTNIDGSKIVLKGLKDYKYCIECERWVHSISVHCSECKNCCSKDGKPSAHCSVCDKCVRETYVHCFTCEICTRKGECSCGYNAKNKIENYCSDDEFDYNENLENTKNENEVEHKISVGGEDPNFKVNDDNLNDIKKRNFIFKNNHFKIHKKKYFDNYNSSNSFNSKRSNYNLDEKKFVFKRRGFNFKNKAFKSKDKKINVRQNDFHKNFEQKKFTSDDFNKLFFNKRKKSH